MKTIFVIGNGFDLAHNLKTSYNHFMSSLNSTQISNNKLLDILRINNSDSWSDIEYTYFRLLNSYNDRAFITKTLKYSKLFSNSKELDENFENIKKILEKYLLVEQESFIPIETYSKLFSQINDKNTIILDFNYTNTIKNYLNDFDSSIKHIKIHGELNCIENPIIFGYAANDEESKTLSDKNDEFLMKNIKKLRYILTDNETEFKEILDRSVYDIDVYILGHSCGISDRLILHELFTHKKVRNITSFYYQGMEGFLKTVINIDRIIDDYSKNDKKEKSFKKLSNYKKSTEMIQHNSTNTNIEHFTKYINLIKNSHVNKKSHATKLASIL